MAVTVRNIDGSTPWVNTVNPNSVRITYDLASDTQANVLTAVDEWLTGFFVSSVTDTTVVVSVTIPTTTVPASGTLKLYDSSTSLTLSIAYSSYTGSTFTVSGLTAAMAGISTFAMNDATLDKCCISGGYGDTGWKTVGVSGTTIRSYKALNVGGTIGGATTHYKWIILDVATSGYIMCKVYRTVTGVTGTTISDLSTQTGYAQRFNVGSTGTLYLNASERHFLQFSVYGATLGNVTASGVSGIVEHLRSHPAHTVGSGLCQYAFFSGGSGGNVCTKPRTLANDSDSPGTAGGISFSFGAIGFVGGTSASALVAMTTDTLTGKTRVSDANCFDSVNSGGAKTIFAGVFYNLKVVSTGTYADELQVAVDANNFLDSAGTPKTFICFPAVAGAISYAVPK